MNELTENLVKEYKPKLAIMVYSTDDDSWDDCYLESHVISSNGAVMAGKPLKLETIEGIVDVFFDQQQDRAKIEGFIPDGLLQFVGMPGGHYKIVWFTTPQKRFLHFSDDLKIPSGEAWTPAMVWVAEKNDLRVYALNGKGRPNPDTAVFRAPYHNIGDNGYVCLGDAKVAKPTEKTYAAVMKYWEEMFWKSVFTHLSTLDSPTKTNINMLWRRLIKDNTVKWDSLDVLKPVKKDYKLKNIL